MRADITPKQEEVLEFIEEYISLIGYPPTRADIAERLGKHKTTIGDHLDNLETGGHIRIDPGVTRGIVLLD